MSWFRVGDTAATDPRRLALNDPNDPLIGITCFGFLVELGTLSASNKTDYVLTQGFLIQAGGAAWEMLLRRCQRAGLIIPLGGRGAGRRWKLIDDAPELFHIRLKDEQAWEKQQKADTRSDRNRITVFLRDGDSCRYCGVVVQPNDTRSGRGRSIDHRNPGMPARGPDDLVVACRSCNGARGRDWQNEEARAGFDARWPLLPIPTPLIFIRSTVVELEDKGHTIPADSVVVERAKPARDTATQTSGPAATHPTNQVGVAAPARSTTAPDDQHPTSQVGVAAPESRSTTGATRPASQAGAAASTSTAGQHPAAAGVAATEDSTTAPECQHSAAPAGVAAPESRTDRSAIDRFGTAGPGRVGSGSGRAGSGGFPPSRASPSVPPSPTQPSATAPRRTRRGRRSRSGGTPT